MDYDRQLKDLIKAATYSLRDAQTTDARREAVVEYLRQGFAVGATSGELMDFFYVSTPNILEEAGYSGDDADAIAAIFDEEHERLGAH